MSPLEGVQPAHAAQGGVERQQHLVRHQSEIDQQFVQDLQNKKNAEKKDKTQETKDTDKAIIQDKERQKKKNKEKKGQEKGEDNKVNEKFDKNDNREINHIDIKI